MFVGYSCIQLRPGHARAPLRCSGGTSNLGVEPWLLKVGALRVVSALVRPSWLTQRWTNLDISPCEPGTALEAALDYPDKLDPKEDSSLVNQSPDKAALAMFL